MADGTATPIEAVREGDWVLADDPQDGQPPSPRRVIAIMTSRARRIVAIRTDGDGLLEATREHPFWTLSDGWVAASQLRRGDILLGADGSHVTVVSVAEESRSTVTHNLSVDGLATYFVLTRDSSALVHNQTILDRIREMAPIRIPTSATVHGPTLKPGNGVPYHNTEWRWNDGTYGWTVRFHGPASGALAAGDGRAVWIVQRTRPGAPGGAVGGSGPDSRGDPGSLRSACKRGDRQAHASEFRTPGGGVSMTSHQQIFEVEFPIVGALRFSRNSRHRLVLSEVYLEPLFEKLMAEWLSVERDADMPSLVRARHRMLGPYDVQASPLEFVPEEHLVTAIESVMRSGWTPDLSHVRTTGGSPADFRAAVRALHQFLADSRGSVVRCEWAY